MIAFVIVLLLAGGGYYYDRNSGGDSKQKYRRVRVDRGDISQVVTATGTINPVITVLVGSQVSGTIKALYADFNSRVKEDQVIAQIDPAIFEAQVQQGKANVQNTLAGLRNAEANLQNAQAGFLNSQAALETSRANLAKAEVSVIDTKRTLDRNLELMKRNVIAQSALDTAQANYDSAVAQREASRAQVEQAKAQVESSRAQVETARSQIESAKAQIEQAKASLRVSETNLRYATIRSPVNGIVISRNVDVGQTVAASLQAPTLFTIAKDLTEMQVDTNVSEADVGLVELGQDADFTVDAYPERTFRGKVSEIRNAPTTIQNVVTYDIVLRVGNNDFKLKPGMTANVSILIAHREGVLKVPNSALRFQPSTVRREDGGEKKKGGPPQSGQQLVERLSRELKLTAEQQAKVEAVLKASRQEIQEIRAKAKPEEARARVQALLHEKIGGILTDEQRRKYDELAKSPAAEDRRPARVWILSQGGKTVAVPIFLGITNGTYSEVTSGDLQEGAEVIVEEAASKKPQGSSSPFGRGMGR